MQIPLISIIIPSYNTLTYIKFSIDSVLAQTFQDWELLIVDDCSTDGSREYLSKKALDDLRIRVIEQASNQGVAAARNLGIELSRGEWIAFLDSDDLWLPNKLDLQINLAKRMNAGLVFGAYQMVSESGEFCSKVSVPIKTSYHKLLSGSFIGCLTVLVKRSLIQKHKFKNIMHEDYLMWLNILKSNNIPAYGVQETVASYRIRPSSRSSNKILCAKSQWNIYTQELGLDVFKSIFYFLKYTMRGILKHYF